MKVKLVIFFVFGLFFCNDLESQDIIEQLKHFYEKADVDCYIDEIQKNVNMSIDVDNKNWGRDKYGIFPQKIVLRKEEIVPMLTIQFINTDTFNLNDNIYDHITIDSTIVFTLACVDRKMNVYAFAHFFDGVNGYYEIDNDRSIKNFFKRKRLKHVIKNILKQIPDLILYSHVLCGFHDDNGFMFVKDGKIFVFHIEKKGIYELNAYIKHFFDLERIRGLNHGFVPNIYHAKKIFRCME